MPLEKLRVPKSDAWTSLVDAWGALLDQYERLTSQLPAPITMSHTGTENSLSPHRSHRLHGRAAALDWWSSRLSVDEHQKVRNSRPGILGVARLPELR